MFRLIEQNEFDRRILNVIIYDTHHQKQVQKNTVNPQIYMNIPREDSVVSL